jgi:plastocyanin
MRTPRLVLASAVGAVLVAACTSAGGGAYGGGVYGGGGASSQPVVAAASSAATPLATEAASGATSGGYGGGKGDYGTGGGSPVAVASAVPGAVRLSGFAFEPTTMTAAAGTTLTFANDDGVAHDIVEGTDGTAASPSAVHARLAPGATASVTLPKAGTLALTCTIHPSMNMTVTVTP